MITKDNKGITLVALILTIIIMLILATVTTFTGINTYEESKVYKFVAEMQLIQAEVDELAESKTIEELLQLGTEVNGDNIISIAFSNNEISSNDIMLYRHFSKQEISEMFNIEKPIGTVMINFETREVVSTIGVEYEGNKYYTQYKLPNGQLVINNTESNRELDFNLDIEINGINSTILISNISITNGTLSFAEIDSTGNVISNWKTITNYTEKETEYKTNISKAGSYIFELKDNTDNNKKSEETISIVLTNKPKTNLDLTYNYGEKSDKWAYAQKDGVIYVWVPRFAIDNNNKIKFIKGNSNIATDNTYIDKENWTVSEKFTSIQDGTELTGLWVKVDSMEQAGLVMIILLNNAEVFLTEI